MIELTKNQLNIYSRQILDDYDSKNPSTIFKNKITISNEDAWRIQSNVTDLRQKRGEELLANNAIHARIVIGKPTKGNIQSQITD